METLMRPFKIPEVEVDKYDSATDLNGFQLGDLKKARKN
jgi:hypothetical protein